MITLRHILFLMICLFLAGSLHAQEGNFPSGGSGVTITTVAGLASIPGLTKGTIAAVTNGASSTDCTTGGGTTAVVCQYNGSTWTSVGGTGTGSVTSVSSGNATPLFTVNVATPTSTPAFTFAQSTAAANSVYGNFTGSSAAPSFSSAPVFSAASLTNFPTFNQNTTGSAASLSATLGCGVFPTLTGDVSNSSCATTVVALRNATLPTLAASTGIIYDTSGTLSLTNAPALSAANMTSFPTFNQNTTGNAATATNLASYPSLCTGGQFSQGLSSGSNNCATPSGSGTVNTASQYSLPYYSSSGTANTLSGLAAPTGPNGVPEFEVSTPSGGAATAPTFALPGVVTRDITGTTSTDTISSADCNPQVVNYQGSVAVATSLPTATTLAVPSCAFKMVNNTSGSATAVTVTATTWTFNTTGTSTLVIAQGQECSLTVDTHTTTQWDADCHDQPLVAGSNITITRGQYGPTIASSAGGGTTTNALTGNNSGSGAVSGSTFNGSSAVTFSYNTFGAAPLASPTFTGTVTIPSGSVLGTPTSINLSNATSLPCAALPALTGSVTTSAGSCATTLSSLSSNTTYVENNLAGASAAGTITEGGSTFSVTRAGVSTANLTAPWVFQNTNSTNNNTSITLGITAPGTSTGQTVLNVNGASTGGDLVDFGNGGTWTAGVLSGQTIVSSVLNTGAFVSKGTTAGFVDYPQGSTSSAVSPCNAATSICEQAPTAVTSYLVTKPGTAANGVITNNVASAVDTQGFSGDTNHSTTVTISSATSVGSTSLCSTTACPAGTYQISAYIDVTTACTTTGAYTVSVIYTDDTTVSKTIVLPLTGTGTTTTLLGPAAYTSSLALAATTNFAQGTMIFRSTGAASINYSTTATACGTGGPAAGKMYLSVFPVM